MSSVCNTVFIDYLITVDVQVTVTTVLVIISHSTSTSTDFHSTSEYCDSVLPTKMAFII